MFWYKRDLEVRALFFLYMEGICFLSDVSETRISQQFIMDVGH